MPEPNKSLVKGKDLLEKINVLMSARLLDGESEFKVFCKPEDLEFYIDEKQIGQVLINLVKNALQSVEYADKWAHLSKYNRISLLLVRTLQQKWQ